MDKYIEAITNIVKEQKLLIGPLAIDMARNVKTLDVSDENNIKLSGDPLAALQDLVLQYKQVFGETSVKVSKSAIKSLNINEEELPAVLK